MAQQLQKTDFKGILDLVVVSKKAADDLGPIDLSAMF